MQRKEGNIGEGKVRRKAQCQKPFVRLGVRADVESQRHAPGESQVRHSVGRARRAHDVDRRTCANFERFVGYHAKKDGRRDEKAHSRRITRGKVAGSVRVERRKEWAFTTAQQGDSRLSVECKHTEPSPRPKRHSASAPPRRGHEPTASQLEAEPSHDRREGDVLRGQRGSESLRFGKSLELSACHVRACWSRDEKAGGQGNATKGPEGPTGLRRFAHFVPHSTSTSRSSTSKTSVAFGGILPWPSRP